MRPDSFETNSTVWKREHRRMVMHETRGCDRCPPHGGENLRLKGKRPRTNAYKDHRRGRYLR